MQKLTHGRNVLYGEMDVSRVVSEDRTWGHEVVRTVAWTFLPEYGGSYCFEAAEGPDFAPVFALETAQEATELREELGQIIWTTSRNDESTISATGANIVADAILAAGWVKR